MTSRSRSATVHFPLLAILVIALLLQGCVPSETDGSHTTSMEVVGTAWVGERPEGVRTEAVHYLDTELEPRLTNLRQLTHGGTNAEAYFAPEGDRIVFQASWQGVSECDQIYSMRLDGSELQLISTGEGRTTCGYFLPGRNEILFSSTHHISPICPTPPDRSQGYLWGLFDYDVFVRDLATGEVRQLTDSPGYDGEATLSPDGSTIVFTSLRGGDLDLWAMDPDGELADYQALLDQQLVRGGRLEIYVMDADGSKLTQVTDNRASNFAPYWHPNGRQIIFSSNLHNPGGRGFSLYLINADGSGLERITHSETGFDGFPMFNPDGNQLIFASSRGGQAPGEINVFLAEWVEH